MTVVTPGWSMTQRRANADVDTSGPAIAATSRAASTPTSKGTPAKVSPTSKDSPCRLKFRWSSAGNVVDSSYFGQQAAGQRHPGEDADVGLPRGREQLLQRLAPEDVEDDLQRLDAGRSSARSPRPPSPPRRRRRRWPPRRRGRPACRRPGRPRRWPAAGSAAGRGRGCRRRGCAGTRSIHARRFSGVYCSAVNGSARRPALVATKGGRIARPAPCRMRTSDRPSP